MSAYVSDIPGQQSLELAALVRDFDRDPTVTRERLRILAEKDSEAFFAAALESLRENGESRGTQFLISLLVAHGLLLRALCDRSFTAQRAIGLARAAAHFDPMIDVALAKRLADAAASPESNIPPDSAARILEILTEISRGARILPSLMRLVRNPNPYVRSKAVKLVGRCSASVKWVRGRQAESDPRIRANAIEALWGVDNPEARKLLLAASQDANNRVAGNALVALYRIGECSAITALLQMCDHPSAQFRATAAWAMGETRDSRFSEALARLLRDPSAAIRTRAMAALGRIKTAIKQSRQAPRWMASGMMLHSDPSRPARRLQLAVLSEDGAECPGILPTQFLLSEDGVPVMNYRVTEHPEPQSMSVVFLFPYTSTPAKASWIAAALKCLQWKRRSDLWALQPYLEREGDPPEAGGALPFSASGEKIEASLHDPARRMDCADFWTSVWNAVQAGPAPGRGRRNLILFAPEPPERSPGDELIMAVKASRALVQVVAQGPGGGIEKFCARTGAALTIAETDEAVIAAIEQCYLNLLARYDIRYSSPAIAQILKVQINHPQGWAEIELPLSGQSP